MAPPGQICDSRGDGEVECDPTQEERRKRQGRLGPRHRAAEPPSASEQRRDTENRHEGQKGTAITMESSHY